MSDLYFIIAISVIILLLFARNVNINIIINGKKEE